MLENKIQDKVLKIIYFLFIAQFKAYKCFKK